MCIGIKIHKYKGFFMKRRSYDREFKLNAMLLLKKGGKSQAQICRDLGVPESTFSGWVDEYEIEKENSFRGSGIVRASREERHITQKEFEDIKMERDILKKALAIFSQQK